VSCEFVGGGFGSKLNGAGPEGMTAAKVAAKQKKSAWAFADRSGDQTETGNRPGRLQLARLGVKKDGTSVGGACKAWGGEGGGREEGGGGGGVGGGRGMERAVGAVQAWYRGLAHAGCAAQRVLAAPGKGAVVPAGCVRGRADARRDGGAGGDGPAGSEAQ